MSRTPKHTVRLTIGLAVAIPCFADLLGCQALGLRSRDEMAVLGDEDDWAPPSRNTSQVPRPRISEAKATSPTAANAPNAAMESRYALRNRLASANKNNPVAAYGVNDAKSSSDSDSPNIINTAQSEMDVEGALQSLPPAYRDVLKKQLALVQLPLKDPGAVASSSLIAPSVLEPVQQPLKDDTAAASGERTEDRSVSMDSRIADAGSKPKSGVSVRLTDTVEFQSPEPNSAAAKIVASKEPTALLQPIANAIAVSELQPVAANSEVVQASATAPISSNSVSPATAPLTTTNNTAISPTNWRNNVAQAIEQLEKQIADTSAVDESLRLSQEITLRLLYVAQRRLEDAARPIASLSESEQEFFRHQMLALHEASNPDAMPVRSRHWAIVMNSQREATNYLAAASNIEVKSLAFCTEVERYGVITKFPKYQFRADEEVLLYCEIENVAAEKVRNGFETQLQGSYEIIDAQGRKVADQLLPMEPEICQNHRRDYFIVYKIYMPQQIASGSYQMKLTIEDLKGRKFGQNQIEFQIRK